MKSLKSLLLATTVAAIVMLAPVNPQAFAQTTPTTSPATTTAQLQNVTGGVTIGFQGQNGNTLTGGDAYGTVSTAFTGQDPKSTAGSTKAKGSGNDFSTTGPNGQVTSISNAKDNGTAHVAGTDTTLDLSAAAGQGDWAGKAGNNTYLNGGNQTSGTSGASGTANGPIKGSVGAGASGMTTGNTTGDGTDAATSWGKTNGSSQAGSTLTVPNKCTPGTVVVSPSTVQGNGVLNTGAFAGNPNTQAYGTSTGTASYGATSANGAPVKGSLDIQGASSGSITPGGSLSAYGYDSSKASAQQAH